MGTNRWRIVPIRQGQANLPVASGYGYYGWLIHDSDFRSDLHPPFRSSSLIALSFQLSLSTATTSGCPFDIIADSFPDGALWIHGRRILLRLSLLQPCGLFLFVQQYCSRELIAFTSLFSNPPRFFAQPFSRTTGVSFRMDELPGDNLSAQSPALQQCNFLSPFGRLLRSVKNNSAFPSLQGDLLWLAWYFKCRAHSDTLQTFHPFYINPLQTKLINILLILNRPDYQQFIFFKQKKRLFLLITISSFLRKIRNRSFFGSADRVIFKQKYNRLKWLSPNWKDKYVNLAP